MVKSTEGLVIMGGMRGGFRLWWWCGEGGGFEDLMAVVATRKADMSH